MGEKMVVLIGIFDPNSWIKGRGSGDCILRGGEQVSVGRKLTGLIGYINIQYIHMVVCQYIISSVIEINRINFLKAHHQLLPIVI
jgi:hypothetical protein